jgi:hypothetical protein
MVYFACIRNATELLMGHPLDVCADCKSRNPRWAAYNLGIFIWFVRFVRLSELFKLIDISLDCASIHRKMGSHVSKVYVHLQRPATLSNFLDLERA